MLFTRTCTKLLHMLYETEYRCYPGGLVLNSLCPAGFYPDLMFHLRSKLLCCYVPHTCEFILTCATTLPMEDTINTGPAARQKLSRLGYGVMVHQNLGYNVHISCHCYGNIVLGIHQHCN